MPLNCFIRANLLFRITGAKTQIRILLQNYPLFISSHHLIKQTKPLLFIICPSSKHIPAACFPLRGAANLFPFLLPLLPIKQTPNKNKLKKKNSSYNPNNFLFLAKYILLQLHHSTVYIFLFSSSPETLVTK